jgi:hypothetical protein
MRTRAEKSLHASVPEIGSEAGSEYVTEMENVKLFRKRK